jgi:hypothetical protein
VETWTGWWRDMNQLHARIGALMGEREILPDDAGVRWRNADGSEIMFAFKSTNLHVGNRRVSRVTGDGDESLPSVDSIGTAPLSVYAIS